MRDVTSYKCDSANHGRNVRKATFCLARATLPRRLHRAAMFSLRGAVGALLLQVSVAYAATTVVNNVVQLAPLTVPTPGGWWFEEDDPSNGNASGSLELGPATPPLGIGSARLQTDGTSNGRMLLGTLDYNGTRLDSLTALMYSTYRSSADAGNLLAISLQMNVDYDLNDGDAAWQGRLVFEPYFTYGSGTILQNTWYSWNALTGKWWMTGTPHKNNAAAVQICPQSSPCTLATILATFPNAGIHASLGALMFRAGAPWPNFDGNVDNFTINGTTYDFELCASNQCGITDPLDPLFGTCRNNNTTNPNNQCQLCRTSTSRTAWSNKAATATCNADSNGCTANDKCDGAGTCVPGAAPNCADSLTCTTDTCQSTGNNAHVCNHTTDAGTCLIGGTCYNDGDTSPSNQCQQCTSTSSQVAFSNKTSGASCDADGNGCTQGDACDGAGGCVAGAPPDCSDGLSCTTDTCTSTGATTYACSSTVNASRCLIGGTCFNNLDTNPANDCQQCKSATTKTAWSNKSSGTACNDGLYCNGTDTCNASGSCAVHTGDPCLPLNTTDSNCAQSCNEAADNCTAPDPTGTACADDGNPCTLDQCNGSGTCAHPGGNNGAVCRPAAGQCDEPDLCDGTNAACPADRKRADGSSCDSGLDICSQADSCKAGVCVNTGGGGDPDQDGVCTAIDNCPNGANSDQADKDGDGVGDGCDNCPDTFNAEQSDADGDNIGDLCDAEPVPPSLPVTLKLVRLKGNMQPVAGRENGTIKVQGTIDATALGGDLGGLQPDGVALQVRGAGLAAGEVMKFPGTRCVQVNNVRIKCVGTRGEALTLRQKPGNLYSLTVSATKRTFAPPLSAAGVEVTVSMAGLDRRDTIAACAANTIQSVATCKK